MRGEATQIEQQQAAPPATLNSVQLMQLPMAEQKFKAVLPVIPGVVRTPDGKINIKGVAETQGLVLVDSAQTVDPVTGSFAIDIPTTAIESLHVYKSTYNAQYGGFSGGLTSIHTRPPSGRWHFEVENVTPNPRIKSGRLVGIADYNPRLYLTGPLVAKRLSFSESFAYDIDKQPVRGLAWPHNEIKTHDFNSFTNFQYVLSEHHLMSVNVNVFPLRRQFANINSLVPQTASADYGQKGFSVGFTDRFLFASGGVLTTQLQGMKFESNAHGQGPEDMLVTPNGWEGNFFNAYVLRSDQEEATDAFRFPQKEWEGKHELTLGAQFLRRSYRGSSDSHPVLLLRPDGTLAERIDFSGPGRLAAQDAEAALFLQDHWILNEQAALDAGLRYSGQTLGAAANLAPRLGLVFSPGAGGKTILRGGIGVFYDRAPLLGGDFVNNPARIVSFFDAQGAPQGTPLFFRNAYARDGGERGLASLSDHLHSTPLNLTWNLEADRELRANVVLRLSYLSSRSYDQFFVDPRGDPTAGPLLLLSDRGSSRYQEFQSTLHIRRTESSEWTFAYVYSRARGNLNNLGQVFVPFEQPVLRPDLFADLPSDVPHRLISWGRFKTHIWGITAAPVIDFHSGFPYSFVNVEQNYVGPPNYRRFPRFFSLDVKLWKEFHLPFPWIRNHLLRGALTVFNVTNHDNPRDVFNNTASPFFGHFVGLQHLFYDSSLDITY